MRAKPPALDPDAMVKFISEHLDDHGSEYLLTPNDLSFIDSMEEWLTE